MQTNQPTQSLNFVALLSEGLPYVDAWTPTKMNHGGCGVFAKLLAEELSRIGVEYKIYCLYYREPGEYPESDTGEVNLKDYLQNGHNLKKAGTDHVVLLINDTLYVDSTGVVNAQVMLCAEKIQITKEQLDALVESGKWNPTFDRTTIPTIAKYLDEVFSHLEDFHSGMFKYPKQGEVEFTKHTQKYLNPFGDMSALASLFR